MSINIIPLYVDNPLQNYIWLIVHKDLKQAIAIDPTDANLVQKYLTENELSLNGMWITHDHFDHVAGVAALKTNNSSAILYAHQNHKLPEKIEADMTLSEGGRFNLWGYDVEVWALEGHKRFHLGYLLNCDNTKHLFSGDIIFKAGCGRVFTGTVDELFDSLTRIATLADDTFIYPTHEFTIKNLEFALTIEPQSKDLKDALAQAQTLRKANTPTLPTTVGFEKGINPFLRVAEKGVIMGVQGQANITSSKARVVFSALRGLKDNF